MTFRNDYDNTVRAAGYARMQFPGTYELAFRDLPEIIRRQTHGDQALDFGCGAGRSTRFLKTLGYEAIGVDISGEMLANARQIDASGDYRQIHDNGRLPFADAAFDLIFSAFTFDNIPGEEKKSSLFTEMGRILKPGGRLINLVSTPEIYRHEWASFTTRDFPQNHLARCGDPVLIINTSSGDTEPVADILWPDEDYQRLYHQAGLELLEMRRLLARPDETFPWVSEARIAPWCVYVLRPSPRG